MEIRPMKMKDLVKVRDLEILCIREYFSKEIENKWEELPQDWKDNLGASNPRSFRTYLEGGLSFVAVEDDEIMGFIFAQMIHHVQNVENLLWIENMGVHPYFRRNGIGYKLLQAAVNEGRKRGATVARSAMGRDNSKSIMLHKKMGFFMDRRETALLDMNDLNKKN